MDLSELIMNIQQLAPQLASTCCIINGAFMTLEDVEKMGYDEFSYRSKINMPLKLYKYFPNKEIIDKDGSKINYSLLALRNNTVYMQSPSLFDDVYDFENMIKALKSSDKLMRGCICIVQPGISKGLPMPDKIQEVLAATDKHVKRAGKVTAFRILGSY